MDKQKDTRLIIRINTNLHQWFKAYAQRMHTTMSTLVIESIQELRNPQESQSTIDNQSSEPVYAQQLQRADSEIQYLRDLLTHRDEQIDHLTQVVGMAQKNISHLTEQLDSSRELIEDMRNPVQRKGFWSRLLYR